MAATLWRSEPTYRGEVADGWFQTSDGRLRYRPLADPEAIRRRLDALIGDPPAPLVQTFAIDGRLPTRKQIEVIEAEIAKAPPPVLRDFRACGGKIEVIVGADARRHPVTSNKRGMNSCGGWFCLRHNLICIAAEADPLAVLHEISHWHDRFDGASGRFSSLPLWRQICGPGPWERRFDSPSEKFAEAFALHFHSSATRDRLGDTVQQFIERATA